MDTSDPNIAFDAMASAITVILLKVTKKLWFPNTDGQKKLSQIIEKIKSKGRATNTT